MTSRGLRGENDGTRAGAKEARPQPAAPSTRNSRPGSRQWRFLYRRPLPPPLPADDAPWPLWEADSPAEVSTELRARSDGLLNDLGTCVCGGGARGDRDSNEGLGGAGAPKLECAKALN